MNSKMLCPSCRSELVTWFKPIRYETLDEHVCNPNAVLSAKTAYVCQSESCRAKSTSDKNGLPVVFWGEDGALYGSSKGIEFIDGNNGAFGSLDRKCNVEIYKKDENRLLLKFQCWPLKGWRVLLRYSYQSNENGDILRRRPHFEWVESDGTIHTWGLSMLKYSLGRTFKHWRGDGQGFEFHRKELESAVQRGQWPDAEWWRKVNARMASLAIRFQRGRGNGYAHEATVK